MKLCWGLLQLRCQTMTSHTEAPGVNITDKKQAADLLNYSAGPSLKAQSRHGGNPLFYPLHRLKQSFLSYLKSLPVFFPPSFFEL